MKHSALMKTGLLLLISSLMFFGCTRDKSPSSSQSLETLELTGSGSFGSLNWDQSVSKILSLKNPSSSSVTVNPVIEGVNASSFVLVSSRGCGLVETQRVCSIKVMVSARGLAAGNHEAKINLGVAGEIPLTVTINSSPAPIIEVQVNGVVNTEVNFDIVGRNKISKIISLRNIGPIAMPAQTLSKDLDELLVLQNSCVLSLAPGKTCFIKVGVAGKNENLNSVGSILIGSILELPVNINSVATLENPNLVTNEDVDFGFFSTEGQKRVEILTFTNTGVISGNLTPVLPPGYSVVANSCSSVVPKGKCYLKIQYTNQNANLGSHSSSVTLGNTQVNFTSAVVSSKALAHINLAINDNIHKDDCSSLQLSLEDEDQAPYVQSSNVSLSSSLSNLYSDSSCQNSLSSVLIPSLTSQTIVYLKNSPVGNQNLSFSVNSVVGSKTVLVYEDLLISPSTATLSLSNTLQMSASGGKSPYVFQVVSGGGTISSGLYSPTSVGAVVIKVTDSVGQESLANLTINSNLVLTPGTCGGSTLEGTDCQVSATGGVGSLTFSTDLPSVINPSSGVLTPFCLGNDNNIEVFVTDAYGNQTSMNYSFNCVYSGCSEVLAKSNSSGNYWIDPDGLNPTLSPEQLYCEFDANGAWTLVSRLNTNDGISRTYLDAGFWEGTGTGSLSGTSDYMAKYFSLNTGFREIRLKYNYGASSPNTTIESVYRKADNTNSLKQNLLLPPSNSNPVWSRVLMGTGQSSNFFGSSLIFKTIGNGVAGNINAGGADLSRIWYNLQAVGECNQGGSIGHIGDYGSNNWTWEVGRGYAAAAATCPQNGYRMGVGTNMDQKTFGTNAIVPVDIYSNGSMFIFTKDTYYHHPKSCLDAKNKGRLNLDGNTSSGLYTVDPDGFSYGQDPVVVYCDMITDGGGWTLVSYAGTIPASGKKSGATGSPTAFMPLFHVYGNIDNTSFTSKTSWSRFDIFKPLAVGTSRFLAKRTSVPNKMISWSLVNANYWGGTNSTLPAGTPTVLRMTNSGESGWSNKNNAFFTTASSSDSGYPGISWNTATIYENTDNTGSYTTSLSRRSLLYWVSVDYEAIYGAQWFHATPLSLEPSVGASNNVQDVEFYFRE